MKIYRAENNVVEAMENDSIVSARDAIAELEKHDIKHGREIAEALSFASDGEGNFKTAKLLEWLGY